MPRVPDGSTGSLFDSAAEAAEQATAPLAVRMRPQSLNEVIGQAHLIRDGSPLRKLADTDSPMSVILWGPPGTGKTTLAYVVANVTKRRFVELSAVSAGVKDVRAAIETARGTLGLTGEQTVLFIDEVHRFNKAQQDALLPAVENRWVSFIGATTENPSFSVIGPLLSRSLLLTLRPLNDDDIRQVVDRALADERGLGGRVRLADGVIAQLVRLAGGDARRVLTYLEAAALGVPDGGEITVEMLERAVDRAMVRYDRAGDQHYDVISAFIKSMRGSDADAAIHYLARMIEAGEDPRYIARRLIVHASEDVGMADPTALQTAVAAAQAVEFVGLPEARLNLAQAVIHIALAPKSNAVAKAIWDATSDVQQGLAGPVPRHLRDSSYAGAARLGHGKGYLYAHDDPAGVVQQQYAPDGLVGRRYYVPTTHGAEARVTERSDRIRAILQGTAEPTPATAAETDQDSAGQSAEHGAAEHGAAEHGAAEHGAAAHGPAEGDGGSLRSA